MTILFESIIFIAILTLAIYGIAVFNRLDETNKRMKESITVIGEVVDEILTKETKYTFYAEDIRNNLYSIKTELKQLNRLIVLHHTIDEWDKDLWKKEMPK